MSVKQEGSATFLPCIDWTRGIEATLAGNGMGFQDVNIITKETGVVFTTSNQQDSGEEVFIAVMGRSGAGKSSFINLASNSSLRIGEGLESCTETVEMSEPFQVEPNGPRIRLIDTPGFDDSSRSDADVLNTIATFLANEYKEKERKLSGIIYFHRISDVRMGASSRRNFVMFQKLCGPAFLANVVLATTRWSEVNADVGEARENELKTKAAFFKPIIDAESPLLRYENTLESAHKLLGHLVNKTPLPLLIQREIADEMKAVSETAAGLTLQQEILEQTKRHEEEMCMLLEEIDELKQEHDEIGTKELHVEVRELRDRMMRLQEETQKLSGNDDTSRGETMSPVAPEPLTRSPHNVFIIEKAEVFEKSDKREQITEQQPDGKGDDTTGNVKSTSAVKVVSTLTTPSLLSPSTATQQEHSTVAQGVISTPVWSSSRQSIDNVGEVQQLSTPLADKAIIDLVDDAREPPKESRAVQTLSAEKNLIDFETSPLPIEVLAPTLIAPGSPFREGDGYRTQRPSLPLVERMNVSDRPSMKGKYECWMVVPPHNLKTERQQDGAAGLEANTGDGERVSFDGPDKIGTLSHSKMLHPLTIPPSAYVKGVEHQLIIPANEDVELLKRQVKDLQELVGVREEAHRRELEALNEKFKSTERSPARAAFQPLEGGISKPLFRGPPTA